MNEVEVRERFLKNINNIFVNDKAKLSVPKAMHYSHSLNYYEPDMIANLKYGDAWSQLIIEFKSNGRPGTASQVVDKLKNQAMSLNAIPFFVAPYIGPEARRILRENKILFADLSGNKWIDFNGLYIDVQGRPNQFLEQRGERDPFADKASLILRAMFEQPKKRWRIHEIASMVNVTPGFVSKISNEMKERGYIRKNKEGLQLKSIKPILDDWVFSYNYEKNKKHKYFYPAIGAKGVLEHLKEIKSFHEADFHKASYALAIQAGAYLVAHYSDFDLVHIYIKDDNARERLVNKLNVQEVERGHNIVLLEPYYRQSVFYGVRQVDGLPVVSDLQLYIDLFNYPIRGVEQAEHLYQKKFARIASEFSEH